ncbi:MAG TPA: AI-2E family transporter [Pyrinomonadaceae bacterium]|nr:AI-2E family transporter [Pyrinomonadaceae bacterium]
MTEKEITIQPQKKRERAQTIRRVVLDPSSPSLTSIVRVVIITLIILAVFDFFKNVISSLTSLFFMLVLAVFFAYLINPLVKLIREPFKARNLGKFMPRALAIAISYILVFTVLGVGIAYITPRIAEQAKTFATNVPTYTTNLQNSLTDFNRRLDRMRISDAAQKQINEQINSYLSEAGTYLTTFVGVLALDLVLYAPWFILIPILSFFFLKDAELFRVALLRFFPAGRWRGRVDLVILDVNNTLAAYARAQLISCVLIGTVCTIGFYLLGNNYALLLGILAGIFEFVPLIGPLAIGVIATTVAGFESGSQAAWTGIFLAVFRIIHDYVTYPRIVREGIHLHPLAIILSVLAGEQVAGIKGVFIAIPIVSLATVIYRHILQHSGNQGLLDGILENKETPKKV